MYIYPCAIKRYLHSNNYTVVGSIATHRNRLEQIISLDSESEIAPAILSKGYYFR